MGLYLHLRVNIKKIKAEDWESAWMESFDALRRFPLPLCRLGAETKSGQKRLVYARDIRINQGQADEGWKMEGDLLSGKRGETFFLYRHLSRYLDEFQGAVGEVILWDSKTQGCPYHLALLTVGIILENRFPGNCRVSGDIDQKQVDAVLAWLEAVCEKSFLPPLCLDAERLFLAVKADHENDAAAIDAFGELWRGDQVEKCRAFLKYAGQKAAFDHYAQQMNAYNSLGQRGANDILRNMLEATESLPDLIAFLEHAAAQRPPDREPFDWLDVLRLLCDDYIFVNPVKREALKRLTTPGGDMPDINEVFGRLLLELAGMPYVSPLYIPADELLECFALRDPARGKEYHDLIEKEKAELEKLLSKVDKTVGLIDERIEQDEALQSLAEEEDEASELAAPHERYILRQAWRQKDRYGPLEEGMGAIRKRLSAMIQEHATSFDNMPVGEYLKGIYDYTSHTGIALSEAAWAAIDALTDTTILKYLHALSAVHNNERSFWRLRIHIFETPDLWEAFREEG